MSSTAPASLHVLTEPETPADPLGSWLAEASGPRERDRLDEELDRLERIHARVVGECKTTTD